MKIGDQIYCKKSLIRKIDKDFYKVVLKDKTYIVLNISSEINFDNKLYSVVETTSEYGTKCWGIDNKGPYFIFEKYFISLQELRKLKLEKLKSEN